MADEHSRDLTVLVTGIGGFLARHVALQLLEQGYRVRGSLRSIEKSDVIARDLAPHCHNTIEYLSFVQADLDSDDGWDKAVKGCSYVIHTASPFPPGFPENEHALIQTARDGALRVLRAAHRAAVKRVVMTSSVAATNHGDGQAPFTEENWTDVNSPRATPYYKSKRLCCTNQIAAEFSLPLNGLIPRVEFSAFRGP